MNWGDRADLYVKAVGRIVKRKKELDEIGNPDAVYNHYYNNDMIVLFMAPNALREQGHRYSRETLSKLRNGFLLKYAGNKLYDILLRTNEPFSREHLIGENGGDRIKKLYTSQIVEEHIDEFHKMGNVISFLADLVLKYSEEERRMQRE